MAGESVRSGAHIPLWFSVPQAFTEIALDEDPEVRARSTAENLAEAMPHTSGEQRLHFVLTQQHMIDQMISNDVVYAATMLAKGDHENEYVPRLTTAMLTVLVQDLEVPAPQALHELAEKLRNPDALRDVGWIGLPAGQALVVVEDREARPEMTILGDVVDVTRYIRQLQLTLPFPDRRRIATFTICTENLTDWEDYTDIFGSITSTISFTPPKPPRTEDRPRRSLTSELNDATTFN